MFHWDDLRVFTEVARSKSFAAAASRLYLDTTTVGRRITRLESSLKTTLVVRSKTGVQLTAAGGRLFALGERVASILLEAQDSNDSFTSIRISSSDGFGNRILAPALAELFKTQQPITIELAASQGALSLSNREVDVAISLTPPSSSRTSVEVLTDYELGLYGSAAYFEQYGRPRSISDLEDHSLIGYIDDLIYSPELRYLSEIHQELWPRLTSSSIQAQMTFVRAGAGLAILPCFLVDPDDRLERVLETEVRVTRTFWLLTHNDIKDTRRVRSVRRWLKDLVAEQKPLLLPSAAQV